MTNIKLSRCHAAKARPSAAAARPVVRDSFQTGRILEHFYVLASTPPPPPLVSAGLQTYMRRL